MVEVEAELSAVPRCWLDCFFPWEEVVEGAFFVSQLGRRLRPLLRKGPAVRRGLTLRRGRGRTKSGRWLRS